MERVKNFGKSTFASLKIRNYRLYFIGQAVSVSGTWMQGVAQSWLVLTLTHSGTALGLLAAAQFLPILLLGPWAGLMVDRISKRKMLVFTNGASAILAMTLGLLIAGDWVKLWMVFVIASLSGLINAFDNPARQAFAMELVGRENLTNAISLNSAQFNLARAIGPALAGGLIVFVGLAPCFIINAFSFVAILLALFFMNKAELQPSLLATQSKGQLREGFKYIRGNPTLKNTLIMMAVIGTFAYEFSVALPLLAEFTFKGGAPAYAALTSAMGVGSVIGAFYTASRKKVSLPLLVQAAILMGLSMLLVSVTRTINQAILAMVIVGIFSINLTSLGNVTLQMESPPAMRGRVMSLWAMVFLGSTPIGGPIIGFLGQHLGPRWGIATGGISAILAAGWGIMALKRMSQKQPAIQSDMV